MLAGQGWLAATPAAFRHALLAAGQVQSLRAGEVFSRAGEQGHGIWGLMSGQVSLTSAMNGADAPPGILFHPGSWGGYVPLFGSPRAANGRAVTDSRILTVPYAALRRLLADHPGWWEHIARLVLMDSLRFAAVGVDLMIRESNRRVAAVLLDQAGCRWDGAGVTVHLSKEELGEMMNLSRHPVAAILSTFETRGWIQCGYRVVRILDADALRHFANGN